MADQNEHGLKAVLQDYWKAYGGLKAVTHSPYFWLSVVLLVLTAHFWLTSPWWEQVLSVMPNVLGFTLGGFAIFLGFGDERFKELISGQEEGEDGPSPYMEVSATFLHFVLIQLTTLLMAIVVKATSFDPPGHWKICLAPLATLRFMADMLGYWLFLYGLCITAAAAIAIFRVSSWYDALQSVNRQNSGSDKQ
ncbi:hypothetical protein [Chromobacterium sp. Beijing]|uniref:hypothetical protein n=1 Tax=Chromobacterium sp. Beijing TaxID=2735795 RepID=UPI001F357F34|nr:hypothetical protein [Chromobacterium sp. Beijing]UJB30299.1 hypothetical protein HQN78_04060 [Chromobacterium sp. Beijing]